MVYERSIEIPREAAGKVVKLLFGACNYGAEVWLDDKRVTEHRGPMTSFEADLTSVAQPGGTHTLRVKAWHRFHDGDPPIVPVPFDFNTGVSKAWTGNTKFAYGLTGHVRLAVYPAIYIADVFVRPSVSQRTLACDVWLANTAKESRTVTLRSTLAAWGGRTWPYARRLERREHVYLGGQD